MKVLKTANYMKMAQPVNQTAQDVTNAFEGFSRGIEQGGKDKVQEYAQRIMNGEPKDQIFNNIPQSMIPAIEAALSQIQPQNQQNVHPKVQEYAQRIMNGEPKEQIMRGLPPSMMRDIENTLSQQNRY